MPLTRAYLGLGSSLGDRQDNLRQALARLEEGNAVRLVRVSSLYQSPHMGLEEGDAERFPAHLNCVAEIETSLTPEELLTCIQAVEERGKRQRDLRWGPRTIDIDILLYGSLTLQSDNLTVPHPGISERAFVVVPLCELYPDLELPKGQTPAALTQTENICSQLLERLPDTAENRFLMP